MAAEPPLRREVNRRAYPFVTYLHTVPRWFLFVAAVGVFAAGLFTHGVVGAVLLLVVAATLALLAFLSWPTASPPTRAARLLVIAVVGVLAVVRVAT